MHTLTSLLLLACVPMVVSSQETPDHNQSVTFDKLSITATKTERSSKEVPQSVYLVSEQLLQERNSQNIQGAIYDIPGVIAQEGSGGYATRLIIRGAGLKAPFGIREIMVMKDGVPLTDPDSFTRLDFVDVDDIAQIEVFKGPGSIYGANTLGGVVYISSKSVFEQENRIKLSYGTFDTKNFHLKQSFKLGEKDYFSITGTYRDSLNNWREYNEFDSTQITFKHGHLFDNDAILETEFSYTKANLQLPQALNEVNFANYLKTGYADNNSSAWQKSARNSDVYFFNTRYDTKLGDLNFKPQLFFNHWSHFHPVTAMINDAPSSYVLGTDLAFSQEGFVFGITARQDKQNESKKYTYQDYTLIPFTSRIKAVTSDTRGDLANIEDANSYLLGAYAQHTSKFLDEKLLVDVGMRYDYLDFTMTGTQYIGYSWKDGNYTAGSGAYTTQGAYHLFAPKAAATYNLNTSVSFFGIVAAANQAPTANEVSANEAFDNIAPLKASTSMNVEVGAKYRAKELFMDASVYNNDILDEIVQVPLNFTRYYANAGHTRKQGAELSLQYTPASWLNLGVNAALYHFTYVDYKNDGIDYSGKAVRYMPRHMYTLYAGVQTQHYFAKLESQTFGRYYMDDLNTQSYDGYTFVTNLNAGYTRQGHTLQLNIRNLFNQYYATIAEKDTSNRTTYVPGTPLAAMITYKYDY